MTDGEVEVEDPYASVRKEGMKETNWKDEDRELLITAYDCRWDVAHEDCMNKVKKEVQMSGKYGIKSDYYSSKWGILRSQVTVFI